VKLARLTRGKESSSWRTARTNDCQAGRPNDGKDRIGPNGERYGLNLSDKVIAEANWPTANARDWKDSGPTQGNRQNPNLGTAVVKDAANWSTPESHPRTHTPRNVGAGTYRGKEPLANQVAELHGQAAPASSSSLGSRQGLWLTPRANEPDSDPNFAARNADRGAHCHGTLSSQAKGESNWNTPTALMPDRTPEQIVAASKRTKGHWGKAMNTGNLTDQVALQNWPTITAHTPDMESNGPNGNSGTYLAGAVKQWATPTSAMNFPVVPRENCASHQRAGHVGNQLGRQAMEAQWATPRNCGGPDYAKTTRPSSQSNSLSLPTQVAGKLNPRWVETLMGLPIGWTMPSCTSPQTIAPMSCDSSAMELSQPLQSGLSEFSLAS
jgi:hypothetical protein